MGENGIAGDEHGYGAEKQAMFRGVSVRSTGKVKEKI